MISLLRIRSIAVMFCLKCEQHSRRCTMHVTSDAYNMMLTNFSHAIHLWVKHQQPSTHSVCFSTCVNLIMHAPTFNNNYHKVATVTTECAGFSCDDGECLAFTSFECDFGAPDCADGSDESEACDWGLLTSAVLFSQRIYRS